MKDYQIATTIDAPPEAVWQILTTELPDDPNPFGILQFAGEISEGAKIKIWSEVDPKRAFSLRVTKLSEPNTMIWRGGMPLGLFTGTRTFKLSSAANGTAFKMREVFSGPLSGPICKSIPDLTPSFQKFADALKRKAEDR